MLALLIIYFILIYCFIILGLLIIGLTPLAQWLGAANSCINPILYFFFNPKFRSYLRKAITKSYLRYLNHRDSNYLTNCNVKNSYHWRSATVRNTLNLPPTPSSLTGSLPATHMCVVLVLYFEPDDANMRRFCIYI